MKKIELEIIALSQNEGQAHSYAVVLGELNGMRKMPIIIGAFEAQSIALALERMLPSRPLTHDLMKNMMLAFAIDLEEVNIYKLDEGIFYSKLICKNIDGKIEIDSRTSDAISLAVRFKVPIYTSEAIINSAHLPMNEIANKNDYKDDITEDVKKVNELKSYTIKELEIKLNEVLEQEDYLNAAVIRDEINARKTK